MECVTDNFNIIVSVDLTTLIIVGSIIGGICTVSFCGTLIIGGGVVALRLHRNKLLGNESNVDSKELKEEKELQKLNTSNDKKIVIDNELSQLIEEQKKPAKVNEDEELDAIPYFRED
jgi:hypothetical protein